MSASDLRFFSFGDDIMVEDQIITRRWELMDTPLYMMDFLKFNVDMVVPSGRTITRERLDKNFPCRWDATPTNYFGFVPTDPKWKDNLKE